MQRLEAATARLQTGQRSAEPTAVAPAAVAVCWPAGPLAVRLGRPAGAIPECNSQPGPGAALAGAAVAGPRVHPPPGCCQVGGACVRRECRARCISPAGQPCWMRHDVCHGVAATWGRCACFVLYGPALLPGAAAAASRCRRAQVQAVPPASTHRHRPLSCAADPPACLQGALRGLPRLPSGAQQDGGHQSEGQPRPADPSAAGLLPLAVRITGCLQRARGQRPRAAASGTQPPKPRQQPFL